MAKVTHPDVVHSAEEMVGQDTRFTRHLYDLSDLCPICEPRVKARIERGGRITLLLRSLREFGYGGLTPSEVAEAYDIAIVRPTTAEDGVIAMLVRSQLEEAGIVNG